MIYRIRYKGRDGSVLRSGWATEWTRVRHPDLDGLLRAVTARVGLRGLPDAFDLCAWRPDRPKADYGFGPGYEPVCCGSF